MLFYSIYLFIYFYISLTVGTSRLIEAQMDLPHLLIDAGFHIFIVTPQMFRHKVVCLIFICYSIQFISIYLLVFIYLSIY